MALSGEKVGIPDADEAPLVVMPRIGQPLAGLAAIALVFVISLITWWLLGFGVAGILGNHSMQGFAALIGGFGLIGVLWAIWFENWPWYDKLRSPWKVGIAGTIANLIIIAVFFVGLFIFMFIYGVLLTAMGVNDPTMRATIEFGVFGALSASVFSFAVLWLAGSMYWPFFKNEQPKRGMQVWILGTIITLIVWVVLFFIPGLMSTNAGISYFYGVSMAWTQWLIFFSLLTLMVFEYWPWSKMAPRQPWIGVLALVGCAILGFLVSFLFPFVVAFTIDPLLSIIQTFIFQNAHGAPPAIGSLERLTAWGVMSITFADFLIAAVILVALFFDNWPKQYTQTRNFITRLILVLVIGTIGFFAYYFLSPIFVGEYINFFRMIPTNFLLWFLWIEILFAYVWRKWPIYTAL